jgi:hypothetical protein
MRALGGQIIGRHAAIIVWLQASRNYPAVRSGIVARRKGIAPSEACRQGIEGLANNRPLR